MRKYLFALTSIILLVACVNEEDFQVQPPADMSEDVTVSASVAGRVYVKFSDEMLSLIEDDLTDGGLVTRSVGLNQSLESLGISSIERVFTCGGKYEARQRKAGLHKWYVVTYAPTVPVTKASGDLARIEGVECVEPVRQIEIKDEVNFNDLDLELWGIHNTQYAGIDVNVKPVWEHYTVGNPNVVVAVVDSGVDTRHPDLKDNCTEKHYSFTKGPLTPESHGTHVAGTIAAAGNNGIGICGVAGGDAKAKKPGVKITSYQIFEGDKRVPDASADAIRAAADNGAVICQNSWGYVYDIDNDKTISADEYARAKMDNINGPDKDAIDYFIENAGCDENGNQRVDSPMKGGLVIFAAGNDAIDICYPAMYSRVVAVGAIDRDGKRADFSNYGDWVDIAAPGVAIKSTLPDSQYGLKQGTSMACPHVSGVAALILSHYAGPGFTADMLKEKLLNGANKTKVASGQKVGPLVDAYGAITYGDTVLPNPVEDFSAEGRGDNIDFSWTQTDDEDGKPVHGAMIVYGTDRSSVEAATPRSYEGCRIFTYELDASVGEEVSCTLSALEFSTVYYCKIYNYTYSLNYSSVSDIIEVATTENHAPALEISSDQIKVKAHEVVAVQFNVTDIDGHSLTIDYQSGSEADVLSTVGGVNKVVITGKAAQEGSYMGRLTVTDQHGLSTSVEIPYSILANTKPAKLKEIEDIYLKSRAEEIQIDMSEYVTDADGEQLVYEVEVENPQVVFFSPQQDIIYLTPLKYGQSDVKVIAKDVREEKVEFNFNVLIKDPSIAVSAYPNPVKDYLNVSTGDPAETTITISSATGQIVYDCTSEVSAREPARIDMRDFAPGVYKMTVKFSGKEYSETIVKL